MRYCKAGPPSGRGSPTLRRRGVQIKPLAAGGMEGVPLRAICSSGPWTATADSDTSRKATSASSPSGLRWSEAGAACAGEASGHAGSSTPRSGLADSPLGPGGRTLPLQRTNIRGVSRRCTPDNTGPTPLRGLAPAIPACRAYGVGGAGEPGEETVLPQCPLPAPPDASARLRHAGRR
jgi:hypothetical protein